MWLIEMWRQKLHFCLAEKGIEIRSSGLSWVNFSGYCFSLSCKRHRKVNSMETGKEVIWIIDGNYSIFLTAEQPKLLIILSKFLYTYEDFILVQSDFKRTLKYYFFFLLDMSYNNMPVQIYCKEIYLLW